MPPKRTLTEDEIKSIESMYVHSKMPVRDISRIIGVRTDTVTKVLDDRGIEIRSGRTKLTPKQELEVLRLHDSGVSSPRIAEMYSITQGTVTRILGRHGVPIKEGRPRGRGWSDEDRTAIVSMYRSGMSQQQIAGEMGISQAVISRVLQSENEPIPARPFKTPEGHSRYKGGRVLTTAGYWQVIPRPEDQGFYVPNAGPYVLEHRLVMGKMLGRPLTSDETVHHKDGDRTNNDPSNLQLRQGRHGKGVRYTCNACGSSDVTPADF